MPSGRDLNRRRWAAALILGLATGLAGALLGLSPWGLDLEERFGLDALFLARGPRPAPPEVVVVSIDKSSADRFGLPNEPRRWPRALHARLIDNLARAGATAVGFDIIFDEPRDPRHDRLLAQAVGRAGNVVLFEYLKKETLSVGGGHGRGDGEAVIERLVQPLPSLAQAAVATAPFPLPRVPVKVSQYWLFKGGAGDPPTLPVAMFELRALAAYPELRRRLHELTPAADGLPADADVVRRERGLRALSEQLRQLLRQPELAAGVSAWLAVDSTLSEAARRTLASLVGIYRDKNSRYLNYYGPPRAITTLPYYEVWREAPPLDLRGKLVLVGFSERRQPEQKDGFYTTYTQETSGLDISGVEIAATALANIIEDNPVRPLNAGGQLALLLLWGLLVGALASLWRASLGAVAVAGAVLVYGGVALQVFSVHASWLPLVVPLAFQAPLGFVAALAWHHRGAVRERNRIRQAFRHYLPERAVQALARDLHAAPGGERMHGVCLATDAARYTTLAERLEPEALATLMNRYYESLFEPVRAHGGFVSDVVGDAMLAVWAQVQPDAARRAQACRAALEVAQAAEQFARSHGSLGLATRLGLHAGPILLGNIGTVDHFEYRAVGDIVNTATRLQALNKTLGTRVLASREAVEGLDEFQVRDLGRFLLPGKTRAIAVVELRGFTPPAGDPEPELVRDFAAPLAAFQARRFAEAQAGFARLVARFPDDGPTRYYAQLCECSIAQSPGADWDGVVSLTDQQTPI